MHTRKKENMTATFKCKTNGNTVTFRDEVDIVGMRMHPEYEEVLPEQVQPYPEKVQQSEQPVVKRGRPAKKD